MYMCGSIGIIIDLSIKSTTANPRPRLLRLNRNTPHIQAKLIPTRGECYKTPADLAACFFSREELAEARREERQLDIQVQKEEEEEEEEEVELRREQQQRQDEEDEEDQQAAGFEFSAFFSLLGSWFAQFQPQQQR